jgi:hypothetical protein
MIEACEQTEHKYQSIFAAQRRICHMQTRPLAECGGKVEIARQIEI